jgi:hypothetical protein
MLKKIAKIVGLVCLIIGLAVLSFNYIFELHKTIKKQKDEIDSFYIYFNTLDMMKKTLEVAYPYISSFEAKYYSHMFYDKATEFKVDWAWYPSTIRAETNWNHTLISKKKARGVMQITPICAIHQAERLQIPFYKEGYTEWNEINNVIMGIDYLSQGFVKGEEYAIKRYIGGDGFKNASDTNKIVIENYSKEVIAEQAKVDSIFQEHAKLKYIYKGVQYENRGKQFDKKKLFSNLILKRR